jgi:Domain of unknown function (DUF927)
VQRYPDHLECELPASVFGDLPETEPPSCDIGRSSKSEPPNIASGCLGRVRARAQAVLNGIVLDLSAMSGDARADALSHAAYQVGGLVGRGQVDRAEAADQLTQACVVNRLMMEWGADAVQREIADGFTEGGRAAQAAQKAEEDDAKGEVTKSGPYIATSKGIVWRKTTRDGEIETQLSNFVARIKTDVVEDDGMETRRVFELEAQIEGRTSKIDTPASQFSSLNWVPDKLGARAYIAPGLGARDHLRAAIQLLSTEIGSRHIYTHTGWRKVDGRDIYCHAGGAIGANGIVPDIGVSLTEKLSGYELPAPSEGKYRASAIRASLALLDVAPDRVMVPLLAATFRAPLGETDFSVHLVGASGQRKSEVAALCQQHWGPTWHGRNLPGEWSSSANALEALAFQAKDAVFVVDDFVPPGASAADAARAHRDADRLLRAQGNRQGRQRMRADTSLRPSKPPRGLILSTGEDTPKGQSLRARMLVLEIEPGDVKLDELTRAQQVGRAGQYSEMMAAYAQWLATDFDAKRAEFLAETQELRAESQRQTAHGRTGDIIAALHATWEMFLKFALEASALSEAEAGGIRQRIGYALASVAAVQNAQQRDADPVERYWALLASAVASGRAHVASAMGAEPGPHPQAWGWRRDSVGLRWDPQGTRIGWVEGQALYLEPTAAYGAAEAAASGHGLAITPETLHRRLRERGHLLAADNHKNTTKVTLEGKRYRVLKTAASRLSPLDGTGATGARSENA